MEKPVHGRSFLDMLKADADQKILVLIIVLIALTSFAIGLMLPLTFPGLFF